MNSMALEITFWTALAVCAYVYVGYPAIVMLLARWRPRASRVRDIEPTVSVVIAAYNEEAGIAARIDNVLALDYPADRLEVLVGSDGSTDATVAQARTRAGHRVWVAAFPSRRGKPAVLNRLLAQARGEIVLLADVRQRFEPDVLRALVRHFADPDVGAVSGELVLRAPGQAAAIGEGAGFYWKYEKAIRASESRVDSTVGATGAIYAIRRALYEPLPEDTLLDDVLVPVRITRRGFRVLFEPGARAIGATPHTASQELTRKVRTIAGNFQLFAREPWLLNPFANRLWFQTVSHKFLRLAVAPMQVVAFAANAALALVDPLYLPLLAAQLLFYGLALGGWAVRGTRRKAWPLTLPYTICLLSWATLVAFVRYATGRADVRWHRASPELAN